MLVKHNYKIEDHDTKRVYIAYHHWHEDILLEVYKSTPEGSRFMIPLKISKEMASRINLPNAYRIEGSLYWNIPTQNTQLISTCFNACDSVVSQNYISTSGN